MRKGKPKKLEERTDTVMSETEITRCREYMTNLFRRRSIIALVSCLLTLALAFYGIIAGVIRTVTLKGINGFSSFIYYTMLVNSFAALAAAFVLPFAVEGVRRRRFTLPGWVAVVYYLAACSVAIMMVFVFSFISWASPFDAFGESNLVLHVFCPILILLSFFQTENGHIYSWKDRALGSVPLCDYLVVYYVEVILIGEENGGWPDVYRITEFLHPAVAAPCMLLFAFAVSTAVALVSNLLTRMWKAIMFRYWKEDVDPIEVRIEAYGLGRMAGMSGDATGIQVPLDILDELAKKCGLKTDDLIRPYMTGVLNGRKERDDKL